MNVASPTPLAVVGSSVPKGASVRHQRRNLPYQDGFCLARLFDGLVDMFRTLVRITPMRGALTA